MRALGAEAEIAPGVRGAFEITRDGATAFSKLATARFPTDQEIDALVGG